MAETTPDRPLTPEDWMRVLAQKRAEVALPGFWENIAANCTRWADEVYVGDFWRAAKDRLDRWRSEYRQNTGADLLPTPGLPEFKSKPAASIKGKVIRRCKARARYLDKVFPPADEPPIPRIGDLVRTRVVCRYIDGVEFLAHQLENLATELALNPRRQREGRLEGYFAQHLTFESEAIFRLGGGSTLTKIVCEIQIASEFATRMWDATRSIYEFSREEEGSPEAWQWNPTDPRFIAHQLGHMIHLADGLLVQLRLNTRR